MNKNIGAMVVAGCLLQSAGSAMAFDVGVGAKGGTQGLGGELTFKLAESANLRAHFNTFSYDKDLDKDGIQYKATVDLSSYGLTLDWLPFKGSFRISAGAFSNGNEFNMKAHCTQVCDVGSDQYISKASDPGQVNARVDFKSIAPYAGIGWGNAMRGGRFYMGLDLGVLFQGSPQARMTATGTFTKQNAPGAGTDFAASSPTFQTQLKQEEKNLQDDLNSFKMYPVVNLGLGWRF